MERGIKLRLPLPLALALALALLLTCMVRTGPRNPGGYLNFGKTFSRTGKPLNVVGYPRIYWKSLSASIKVLLKHMRRSSN